MSGPVAALIVWGLCLCILPEAACTRHRAATAAPAPSPSLSLGGPVPMPVPPPVAPDGNEPPAGVEPAVADLVADDLQLHRATYVNPSVVRLELERAGRRFRAKWKAMGPGGSEVQEGVDGNNSPRCEVAAFRLSRLLAAPQGPLVPPVVVRALHRDVPCDRACRGVPRLMGAAIPPTFPALNDHLVLGALSLWIEGARTPQHLHGELWNRERFATHTEYRRSISDLFLFLYVIAHGDANYGPNFLLRSADLGRVYSIDNGRAFDGIPYYVGEGERDWQPLAELSPDKLLAPSFARSTVDALARLSTAQLQAELAVVAAVELGSGRAVPEPGQEAALMALRGRSLGSMPGLVQRSRQTYTGVVGGQSFVLLGIGPPGIAQTAERIAKVVAYLRRPGAVLFSD